MPVRLTRGSFSRSASCRGFHPARRGEHSNNPTLIQDVFFRIGGATPGEATTSLQINRNNVIIDDVWAWRADHGAGVGWTATPPRTA